MVKIAIIGRPNAGKSTLYNQLVRKSLSAISPKAHTTQTITRTSLMLDRLPIVLLDTPGAPSPTQKQLPSLKAKLFKRSILGSFLEAELILFVSIHTLWGETEEMLLREIRQEPEPPPIWWCLNKVDRVHPKEILLEHIKKITTDKGMLFEKVVPLSALNPKEGDRLRSLIYQTFSETTLPDAGWLPNHTALLSCQTLSSQKEKQQLIQEKVREAIFACCYKEIPYQVGVALDQFKETQRDVVSMVTLSIRQASQKNILIGKKGTKIATIRQLAEKKLMQTLQKAVRLKLFVKQAPLSSQALPTIEFQLGAPEPSDGSHSA